MKHRALIPIESRLEGGVNRANLKFTNFKHNYKPLLALELRADDTVICFTEVRFSQTYSSLRRPQWPGLFQPFPLSNGPSDRVSFLFLITWNTKFLQGSPQDWCLLPQLQVSLIAMKESRKHDCKKAKQQERQITHGSLSLSSH